MSHVKPKIDLPNIELDVDDSTGSPNTEELTDLFGPRMPIVQINGTLVNTGDLLNFRYQTRLNNVPIFNMVINDNGFRIRETLKKEIVDTCIVFIGFKDWYIKFQGLITTINNGNDSDTISLNGTLFVPELFNKLQKSYVDNTPDKILSEICTNCNIGYYSGEGESSNDTLSKEHKLILNPSLSNIQFIDRLVSDFTNNIWSIDALYYLHVSDIKTLRDKTEPSKYTIKYMGGKIDETPIIITNKSNVESLDPDDPKAKEDVNKIWYNTIGITNNYGDGHISLSDKYYINDRELISNLNNTVGIGITTANTFTDFEKDFGYSNPFYDEMINKDIIGKSFPVYLKTPIFEITPFDIVYLEKYYPAHDIAVPLLDEENSGLKIVLSYSIDFSKQSVSNPMDINITQTLNLI